MRAIWLTKDCSIKWNIFYKTAFQHGVAPLVFLNIRRGITYGLEVPSEILNKFAAVIYRQSIAAELRDRKLQEGLKFFQERKLKVMVIKGEALNLLVYQQPWYTISQDVDLIIPRWREEFTEQEIQEIGHYFHNSGVEYDFYEHHDMSINGLLPVNFQRIWQNASTIQFRGYELLVMSPADMLISLCINSSRKRYFRLKSLCDIAETIENLRGMDWNDVVEKSIAYECQNIVYSALEVTRLTLGCCLPDDLLVRLKISPVKRYLVGIIIRQLLTHLSLYPYPFEGKNVLGRSLDLSLALPYVSYNNRQIEKKLGWVYRTRARKG